MEVCIGGVWGTVCDDWWYSSDARVVCRQLGFEVDSGACAFIDSLILHKFFTSMNDTYLLDDNSTFGYDSASLSDLYTTTCHTDVYSSSYCCATFGQGSGPIYLDRVSCTGRESSLLDCQYNQNEIGNLRSCSHYEDAGVRCPCKDL